MYEVIWAPEAKFDYWENIDYLLEEFPTKVAEKFITKTETTIRLLIQKNIVFRATSKKGIYQVPIVKQITLFYKVENNKVKLLTRKIN